jgi:hypothetical protein
MQELGTSTGSGIHGFPFSELFGVAFLSFFFGQDVGLVGVHLWEGWEE